MAASDADAAESCARRAIARRLSVRVAVCAALATIVVVWVRLRPSEAETICLTAVQALEQGDGDALVRLADPVEVKRLEITPTKVRRVLARTLRRHGAPGPLVAKPDTWPYSNVFRFSITPAGGTASRGWRRPLDMHVVQDRPGGPYYLRLSLLLMYGAGCATPPELSTDTWVAFYEVAHPIGILGVHNVPADTWVFWNSRYWTHEARRCGYTGPLPHAP